MRIGLARLDAGAAGGFERVLVRVAALLRAAGHTVVDLARSAPHAGPIWGAQPPAAARSHFFEYLRLLEAFTSIDASSLDAVISAHPPSFAVSHERHLSVFMHHQRTFYDAADAFAAAGIEDARVHARATEVTRAVDRIHLDDVTLFLAGSQEVAGRLAGYNDIRDNVRLLRCGPGLVPPHPPGPPGPQAVCVTRQTFLKRSELFVHAMRLLPGVRGVLAGDGDRMAWVRRLAAGLWSGAVDPDGLADRDLWLNPGVVPGPPPAADPRTGALDLPGRVSDAELVALYDRALCVVAPAYGEDYGLTAVEALSFGRPLIVCRDGGALTEFVVPGVNGYVVEPTGPAIAAAITELAADRGLAAAMGKASLEMAQDYRWEDADRTVLAAVEELLS